MIIHGIQGSYSQTQVGSAGDVNGDGFDDIIIGEPFDEVAGIAYPGESFVVFGQEKLEPSLSLPMLDGTAGFRINGIRGAYGIGHSFGSAGDLNGDGFDDLILGAPKARGYSGESFVVFGHGGGFDPTLSLASLDGTTGFRIEGTEGNSYTVNSVSSAGDVNGDGFHDIIIGDSGVYGSSSESYVVFGRAEGFEPSLDLSSLTGATGFKINGVDAVGSRTLVKLAGDVNGDGFDDVILGQPFANGETGSSFVVFGHDNGFDAILPLSALDGRNGFRIDGGDGSYSEGNDSIFSSGMAVDAAGDVNGDGFDDVIIGAYSGGETKSFVVFGREGGFAPIISLSSLDGVTGFRIEADGDNGYNTHSIGSAGDVNGDGFDDLIVGAKGENREAGESLVVFGREGGFDPILSLSSVDATRGFRIGGGDSARYSQLSASGVGDVNGDGFDDVIVAESGDFGSASVSSLVFGYATGGVRIDRLVVRENAAGATVGQLTVTDPDARDSHSFTVSDDRFEVVGGALKLKSGVSLDHEAGATVPVEVTAKDAAGLSLAQRFDVTVSNVNEAATAVRLSSATVRENAAGATIGQLTVTDPDARDSHSFTVSDTRFEVVDGALKLKAGVSLDHEAEATVPVDVTATDAAGLSLTQRFTLAVQDVVEDVLPPVDEEETGGSSGDTPKGTKGNDVLVGNGGKDKLVGGAGHDDLTGGAGHDKLLGGKGNDTLAGDEGNDKLVGGGGRDVLDGGVGRDKLLGGGGNDKLSGGEGNDRLIGGGGKDRLDGGAGNDKMKGGGGADTFIFDLGNDKLVGGGGRDTVEFDGAFGDYDVTFGKKVVVTFEDDRDVLIGMERLEFDDVTYTRQGGEWVEVG